MLRRALFALPLRGLARPSASPMAQAFAARSFRNKATGARLADDEEGVVIGTIKQRNSGKFVVTLTNGDEVVATRAGRMRAEARKLQPGQRVQILFDLESDFDEQTPKIVGLAGGDGGKSEAAE